MAPEIRPYEFGVYSNHKKYLVDFFGDEFIVTVTASCSVIRKWIHDVIYIHTRFSSRPLVVGLGVQWTPAPKKSNSQPTSYDPDSPSASYNTDSPSASYNTDSPFANYDSDSPSVSYDGFDYIADTLQLCVGKQCLIIQLRYCEQVPNSLRTFLRDPRNKFVGFWNTQDADRLGRCTHQLEIEELLDIRMHVKDSEGKSMRGCSFEKMVEECMGYEGVRLEKNISRSNWSRYNLYENQILQASIDTYVCHKLGVRARLWLL